MNNYQQPGESYLFSASELPYTNNYTMPNVSTPKNTCHEDMWSPTSIFYIILIILLAAMIFYYLTSLAAARGRARARRQLMRNQPDREIYIVAEDNL
jgi:nitric oxide reductase large subunit